VPLDQDAALSPAGVNAITAGQSHTAAMTSDGTAWAWGINSADQLGNGKTSTTSGTQYCSANVVPAGDYHRQGRCKPNTPANNDGNPTASGS